LFAKDFSLPREMKIVPHFRVICGKKIVAAAGTAF
jgi:hypothetical protein